jgi:hypothetical protein
MKKVIITIIGVFLINIAYSLDITANTDWYPSTIPTFTGDLIIKKGVTLNIYSGCTLIMSANSGNSERRANPLELETISDVEIYPNPANNTLTIELPSCDKCQTIYRIYDLSGRKVLENTITGSKNIISASELSAGTYFIQLVSNNKTTTQKLIITK